MGSIRGGLFALLIATLTASPAMASEKPFNLALISPIALVKPENGVSAVRLNLIYGENTSVKGLDLGLINRTTTLSSGLQWGFININDGDFKGLQISAFNYNKGTTDGLQWSTFNYAGTAGGLQLAFLNYAQSLQGIQVGLLNIAKTGGRFPVMVIANWNNDIGDAWQWSDEGFLPIDLTNEAYQLGVNYVMYALTH